MLRNGLEPWHLLIVVIVMILLFGSKKLPDAARGLGKSLRILKSETRAMKDDDAPRTSAEESGEASAPSAPRGVRAAPSEAPAERSAAEVETPR